MSSAICFNLNQSKILSSGNGLRLDSTKKFMASLLHGATLCQDRGQHLGKAVTEGSPLNSRFPRSRAWLVGEFYFSRSVSVNSLGVSIILGKE